MQASEHSKGAMTARAHEEHKKIGQVARSKHRDMILGLVLFDTIGVLRELRK